MSYVRLILAAICAIPALVLQICLLPIILLCHIPLSYFLVIHDPSWKKNKKTSVPAVATSSSLPIVQQRQIIVIGGSTGIGYAIAMAAAKEASKQQQQPQDSSLAVVIPKISRIVIVARNLSKLQLAQQSLMNVLHEGNQATKKNASIKEEKTAFTTSTSIEIVSVDVTDPMAITKAAQEIMTTTSGANNTTSTTTYGSSTTTTTTTTTTTGTTTPTTVSTSTMMITHLFLCVGEAQPLHHTQITNEQYHQATLMNQLGTIYTTNAFLPHLKKKKQTGDSSNNSYSTITYTCSMGGQCGVYGYTSYAPTKFALRGYVETLHMELYADNNNNNDNDDTPPIYIQIAYPPDTDTPGYNRENETKPKLTQLISEVAGLATPEQVGTKIYSEATVLHRPLRYQLYFNFDGFLLCTLASGFTPVTTWFDALFQMTIMNLVRIIALFYLNDWHRIIINNNNKKNSTRNSPSKSSDVGVPTATTAAAAATKTTTTSSSKSNNDDTTIRSSTADDPLKND